MNLFDKNQPPPNAYTRAEAMRLIKERDTSRPLREVNRPQWKPRVLWCDNHKTRRKAARQGRRCWSVRVPILTWDWLE